MGRPIVVFGMLGPNGAGKDTAALGARERHPAVQVISTSQILTEIRDRGSALGEKIGTIMDAGGLIDDRQVLHAVSDWIEAAIAERRIHPGALLIPGFPRTLEQARLCDGVLRMCGVVPGGHFVLALDDEQAIARCRIRVAETLDAGQKVRTDDTETKWRHRLTIYHQETMPIVNVYRERCIVIDASNPPEVVVQRILKELERRNCLPVSDPPVRTFVRA